MSTNIIWEDKGIIVGIIKYLTKNNKKSVILPNSRFKFLAKTLFYDTKFKKKGDGFHINIKNSGRDDLVINNLNNLDYITNNTDKVTLLPWYDKDNPLIMFNSSKKQKHSGSKENNKKKMINFVDKFNKNIRGKYHGRNFIGNHCTLNIWDSYYEHKILKKYTDKYDYYNIIAVYNFITKVLTSPCGYKKIIIVRHEIPVVLPTYVEKPVYVPVVIPKKIHRKDKKCEKCDRCDYDAYKQRLLKHTIISTTPGPGGTGPGGPGPGPGGTGPGGTGPGGTGPGGTGPGGTGPGGTGPGGTGPGGTGPGGTGPAGPGGTGPTGLTISSYDDLIKDVTRKIKTTSKLLELSQSI
jgi:hypothetical protein